MGGTINDGQHPKVSNCEYEIGLIAIEKDYANSNRIYFISGSCVFLDDFETVLFEKYGITDSIVQLIIQLKFWRNNLDEIGSKIIEMKKVSSKKWKFLLKGEINKKTVILKKKNKLIIR